MGEEITRHSFIGHAGITPESKVLDVGCGCGKIARPLARFLSDGGEYHGIDITHAAIDWCRQAYESVSNFHFHLADIASSRYNLTGRVSAENFHFPFDDHKFDFIFLGSVFTHMLPGEVGNYLSEISRVLKPEGKCLATFFILDDEANDRGRDAHC